MTAMLPVSIGHLVDAGARNGDGASYHHNCLVYRFSCPAGVVAARAYPGEPGVVSIVSLQPLLANESEFASILEYLRVRYVTIQQPTTGNGHEPVR